MASALLLFGAWAGVRVLAIRAFGERLPILVGIAGPLASYLVCSAMYASSMLMGGRVVPTLWLEVDNGGPAEAAGMKSGDLVVAVDDKEVVSWDDLMKIVRKSRGPLRLHLRREGQDLFLVASPDDHRKLGISARNEIVPAGFGEALVEGTREPAFVLQGIAQSVITLVLHRDVHVVGSDFLGRELTRTEGGPKKLWFLAMIASYLLPGILLIQSVLALDRRTVRPFIDESRLASRTSRFYAFLVDAGLLASALGIGAILAAMFGAQKGVQSVCVFGLGLAFLTAQWTLLTNSGQSLGKRWFKIRIVRCDGSRAGFFRVVVLRSWLFGFWGYVPSLGPVPWLVGPLFVFRSDRRCLHDVVTGTVVVSHLVVQDRPELRRTAARPA